MISNIFVGLRARLSSVFRQKYSQIFPLQVSVRRHCGIICLLLFLGNLEASAQSYLLRYVITT
ncbi:MAG: hypothetical protein ABSG87_05410, partial [Verrucomicrobiota bacterium]